MHTVSAVPGTGAGPNLIRESLLPKDWHKYAQDVTALLRIRDANNRQPNVDEVVNMLIDIGGQTLRMIFLVCCVLVVPVILGCSFIQRFVKAILPQENKIVLKYGGALAIQSKKIPTVALIERGTKNRDHPYPWKR